MLSLSFFSHLNWKLLYKFGTIRFNCRSHPMASWHLPTLHTIFLKDLWDTAKFSLYSPPLNPFRIGLGSCGGLSVTQI